MAGTLVIVILVVLETRSRLSYSSSVACNPFAAIRAMVRVAWPSEGAGFVAVICNVPLSNTWVEMSAAWSFQGNQGLKPTRAATPDTGLGLLLVRVTVQR